MKHYQRNLTSKFAFAAFLALGTLTVTSCNKDKNNQEITAEETQLVVRVAGINNGDQINTVASKRSKSAKSQYQLTRGNDFDVISTVDNDLPATPIASGSQVGLKAASGSRAAAKPVASGTKYTLFLYKKNGTSYTFEKAVELSAGEEPTISVTNGATYKWVAMSYNSTTEAFGQGQTLTNPEQKDVLRAEGEVTISSTNPININFNRVFARIGVELNTMGMFAPIVDANVTITGLQGQLKTGTIDVLTGNVSNLTAVTAPAFSYADFTTLAGSDGQQKIAYYYTLDPTQLTVNVSASNLTIKVDNNTDRHFPTGTASTGNKSFVPTLGQNHRILLSIAESPVTYNNVSWGRSNLYYKAGYNPYRFYHFNPNNPAKEESFFSFRGHLPLRFASNDGAAQKDPCALIYPAGLWKTPTSAELSTVTSNTALLDNLLDGILDALIPTPGTSGATYGTNYIEYTNSSGVQSTVYPAATQKLRFNYNGVGTAVSVVSGLVNLNLGDVDQVATIWSSDRLLDSELLGLNLVGVGAWGYMAYTAPAGGLVPPRPKRAIASKAAGVLNLNALGLGVIESKFQNVRCTRNANWATQSAQPGYNPMPVY